MVESLIKTKELYEQRFNDLYLLLEATEAKAQVAEDSLHEVPFLIDKAVKQAYRKGMNDGRLGLGLSAGWNAIEQDFYVGVGAVYRLFPW